MNPCQLPFSPPKQASPMQMDTKRTSREEESCISSNVVSELHAKGILRLRKGQVVDAISCFHQGLKLLSRTDNDILFEKQLHTPGSPHGRDSDMYPLASALEDRILFTVDLSEDKSSYSRNDDLFVQFRRALYLLPDSTITVGGNYLFNHIMSGVLMYNIGLALHIQGLETCRSDLLPNALHFYAMAHHTFTELCRDHVNLADSLNLALLAIVNNIAHINAHLRNFSDALIFCNELSLRFSCMLGAIDRGAPDLCCDDYEVFVSNVCFGTEIGRYPAPAA